MREAFMRFIRKYDLTAPGDTVLIALSGGADSMALLGLFCDCAQDLSVRLAVAHVDHGLRPESSGDADFARDAAGRYGLPFFLRRVDVTARLGGRGGGVEAGARELRYAALLDCAREAGANRIATAHHRDDQLETLLMRLLRGSGAGGLRGIAPMRADGVIRPLLFATRGAIRGYLDARGIPFVTDSSNLDPTYTRNRLRLEILPGLKALFPGALDAAARSAEILDAEHDYLEGAAWDWLGPRLEARGRMSLEGFAALHPAIQRRALRLYIASMAGAASTASDTHSAGPGAQDRSPARGNNGEASGHDPASIAHNIVSAGNRPKASPAPVTTPLNLSFEHIESLIELARGRTGARLCLPGMVIEKEAAGLRRVIRGALCGEAPLQIPGQTRLPGITLTLTSALPPYALGESPFIQYIDGEKLPAGAVLRGPRPGDRLRALGAAGAKKLSEHMIDRKIPRDARGGVPVIAVDSTILWAAGIALSQEIALTGDSKCVLRCALAWDILEPLLEI